jgi:ATP-binding cassette subfamily F protein 3
LLNPPNLLLLDEPTTHLDMASVDVLVKALKMFEGTLCFISHDVYFIRQLADHVIHVNKGKVTWYPGDYDYFLHKKALEEGEEGELFRSEERIESAHHHATPAEVKAVPSSAAAVPSGKKSKEQKRREAEERNARYRLDQEKKRKDDVKKSLKEAEDLILSEMSRLETHKDPSRVAELTRRLGEITKQLKAVG